MSAWPAVDPAIVAFGLALAAYLFGSIPWGLWLVKAFTGIDVREVGSGNIGTTNVYRAAGKAWAIRILLLDVAKGFLPCWIAMAWGLPPWAVVMVGACAIIGHSKSVFLRFAGGKSVATGIGTILALAPAAAVCALVLFGAILAGTRMVSAGSVGAALALPFLLFGFDQPPTYVAFGALAAIYVVVRHRANIGRIFDGSEARL